MAFGDLDSTNSEALRQGQGGTPPGLWITALSQSMGRGRRGRDWVSDEGNLFASLLLRPKCNPKEASNLSFVAALGVWNTLHEILPEGSDLKCKWPNDILINGKKIGGILLESSISRNNNLDFLILGIGINLLHFPDVSGYQTTSLKHEIGIEVKLNSIQMALFNNIDKWINVWQDFGFGPIRSAWLEKAYNINQHIKVNLGEETFEGTFKGLSSDGGLIVETDDGLERVIFSGEVFPSLGA